MKFQFTIDATGSMNNTANQIMLCASHVFNERYPEQWEEAMAWLAQLIAGHVRSNQAGDGVPPLRVIEGGADEEDDEPPTAA